MGSTEGLEAECATLGAMALGGKDTVAEVKAILAGPGDFFLVEHQSIYTALLAMDQAGVPIDMVVLNQWLTDNGQLSQVGGLDYLLGLTDSVPNAINADFYARTVREKADLRRGMERAEKYLTVGSNGADPNALAELAAAISDHTQSYRDGSAGRRLSTSPVTICMADVEPQEMHWLWQDRIPLGKVSILLGDPGVGKSAVTIDIAARVSDGGGFPDRPGERFEPGGVVLITAEDDLADTVRPRLNAAGADVSRIVALQAVKRGGGDEEAFSIQRDIPALEVAIEQCPGCRLVVVDPINAYIGRVDGHRDAELRQEVLLPLAQLAARQEVTVLAVTHMRKSEGKAVYRAMGSLAFVASARAVWGIAKDQDDPRRRLMLPVKCNLGPDQTGLAYSLRDAGNGQPVVAWEPDPIAITADEALAKEYEKPGPEAEELDRAKEWRVSALKDGPRLAKELDEESKEGEDISKATVRRAKSRLEVVAYRDKVPGPWWWRMPGDPDAEPEHLGPERKQPEHLEHVAGNTRQGGFWGSNEGVEAQGAQDAQDAHVGVNGGAQ